MPGKLSPLGLRYTHEACSHCVPTEDHVAADLYGSRASVLGFFLKYGYVILTVLHHLIVPNRVKKCVKHTYLSLACCAAVIWHLLVSPAQRVNRTKGDPTLWKGKSARQSACHQQSAVATETTQMRRLPSHTALLTKKRNTTHGQLTTGSSTTRSRLRTGGRGVPRLALQPFTKITAAGGDTGVGQTAQKHAGFNIAKTTMHRNNNSKRLALDTVIESKSNSSSLCNICPSWHILIWR